MTYIEVKQLIERLRQRTNYKYMLMSDPPKPAPDADCHMAADLLQEALAFKQEVSDIVQDYSNHVDGGHEWEKLISLIIPKPKPDPLKAVLASAVGRMESGDKLHEALSAALDDFGLEIRSKNDD